jgi:hypothetical protein
MRKRELKAKLAAKQTEIDRLRLRLRVMGSDKRYTADTRRPVIVEPISGEIKSPIQPWGQYIVLPEDLMGNEALMEEIRGKLAIQLAEGLMRQDIVKWIYHDKGDMGRDHATVAAKLYVVPWEFMEEKRDG